MLQIFGSHHRAGAGGDGWRRDEDTARAERAAVLLLSAQRQGNIVILWTCREGQSLLSALEFLRKNGFIPNLVNENAPQTIKMLGHNTRKVFADVYIDDKNG